MGSNFIPEQQETRLCAGIASGSPLNTKKIEMERQELLLLLEFFLLLDQWDCQQEK
jgi:hypothetical protein